MEQKTLFKEDVLDEEESGFPHKLPRDCDLPPILKQVVTNAPKEFKVPSFIACLAPLCCLGTRIRVKYYHDSGKPSALLLQVLIVGEQSSGKSFAKHIEELIIGPTLRARDKEQRRIEQKYRELKRTASKTQKLPDEPKTTIRQIPPTVSKTQLVKRADNYELVLGDKMAFWMFSEELSAVTDAGKQSYSNLRTIMRTAYDLDSYFGIDFASDNSYSAIVDILICSMFCCTPSALDEYMDRRSIEGGNITRSIICELEQKPGSYGAIFKPYTESQQKAIDEALQRLMDDTYAPDGTIRPEMYLELDWLNREAKNWCEKKADESARSGSDALEAFYKSSSVSAFRATALCYYLYNGAPGAVKRCKQIYLFLAEYILQGLLKQWGNRYDRLVGKRKEELLPNPNRKVSVFDMLPQEFTTDQLKEIITKQELTTPERVFLSQWAAKGWITKITKKTYAKNDR